MQRRHFLQLAGALPLLALAPGIQAAAMLAGEGWRIYDLNYAIDLSAHAGGGRLWLPLPDNAAGYQRVISTDWQAGNAQVTMVRDDVYQAPVLVAEWAGPETGRNISVTTRVAVRDRLRELVTQDAHKVDEAALYLRPSRNMPVDGIVAETAAKIVKGVESPDDKARAIYDWVVDNTFRDPAVKGCGMGNIKTMLETGNLGGKCADINSLFVGLCRAAGIPAREMYGVRVAESTQFACMGKAGDVSKAQHCRAEYFSPRYGWVPVDAADVRKAVLEAKLSPNDPQIMALRDRLFGYWEMNWVGFNHARDFDLAPKASQPLPYLMYPYAEFGELRLDGRDPATFRFSLQSMEVKPGV